MGNASKPGDYGTGPAVWDEPTEHNDDSWLFASDRINLIELEIGEDAMKILRSERRFSYPRNKVLGTASIDGEVVGDVGIRMRGGLGSFSGIDNKPKLEIDFNEYSGERFYELESLSLNNMIADCTGLREAISFAAYGHLGLPTSRTGYAQLFVNGQDYGLMLVVETQDDRWLKQNFENGDGNFYDGKYVLAGMWPKLVDFGIDRDHWFDLEEGEDIDFADIEAISQGVLDAEEYGCIDSAFEDRVDWDQILTMLRVEQWIGNEDGFISPNNYRVYFEAGKPMIVSPWDLDAAFPVNDNEGFVERSVRIGQENGSEEESEPWDPKVSFSTDSWEDPGSSLPRVCLDDPACRDFWDHKGPIVNEQLMDGTLFELALELDALISKGRAGDPRLDCEEETIDGTVNAVLAYLETGEMDDWGDGGEEYGCSQTGSTSLPKSILPALLGLLGLAVRRRCQDRQAS